jgi:hypothetical protein
MRTTATDAFWQAYHDHVGGDPDGYDVATFGDSPELSREPVALTVAGTKRATSSLVRDFEMSGEALPRVGGHVVLVDADGHPALVSRTTEIRSGRASFSTRRRRPSSASASSSPGHSRWPMRRRGTGAPRRREAAGRQLAMPPPVPAGGGGGGGTSRSRNSNSGASSASSRVMASCTSLPS